MAEPIYNTEDLIDSRDVIARIEELQSERDDYEPDDETAATWEDENPDEAEELKTLEALAEKGESYASDWIHGATLINESYFTEYAEDLIKDCYSLKDIPPFMVIDWEETADNIKVDYSEVDFDGTTFYIR